MKKIMMLLLATPIIACGPTGPIGPSGSDSGTNISFTATLSMSLPITLPEGNFLVDGDTVCTSVNSCEHKVHVAGTYEITSEVVNSLCVPQNAEIDANSDLILLDLPCALAVNDTGTGTRGSEYNVSTYIEGKEIILDLFPAMNPFPIMGSSFDHTDEYGNRVVGEIANDLSYIHYVTDGSNGRHYEDTINF